MSSSKSNSTHRLDFSLAYQITSTLRTDAHRVSSVLSSQIQCPDVLASFLVFLETCTKRYRLPSLSGIDYELTPDLTELLLLNSRWHSHRLLHTETTGLWLYPDPRNECVTLTLTPNLDQLESASATNTYGERGNWSSSVNVPIRILQRLGASTTLAIFAREACDFVSPIYPKIGYATATALEFPSKESPVRLEPILGRGQGELLVSRWRRFGHALEDSG